VEIKSATSFFILFLVVVGTQFGFQQSKMESQKTFCVNILDRWLNIPTRLETIASGAILERLPSVRLPFAIISMRVSSKKKGSPTL
jgi:hypothetical protein